MVVSRKTPTMISVEPTPSGQLIPDWLFSDLIANPLADKLIIYPSETTRKANLTKLSEHISSVDTSKHLTLPRLFSSIFLDLRLPNIMDNDSLLFTLIHQSMVKAANDGKFPLMYTAVEGRKWSEYKTERVIQLHKELSELKPPWKWDNDPGVKAFRSLILALEKRTKKTHPHLMKTHLYDKLINHDEVPFTLRGLSGMVVLDHCPEFSEMDRALLNLISKIIPVHQLCNTGSFRLGFHGAYIEDLEWATEKTLPKWLPSHQTFDTIDRLEWLSDAGVHKATKWHRVLLERKDHNISSAMELVSDYLKNAHGNIIIVDAAADKNVRLWKTRLNHLGLLCNRQSNRLREQTSIAGLLNALNMGEGLESWSFNKLRRLIENVSFPIEFADFSKLIHPTFPDWKPKPHLEVLQKIAINFHVLGGPGALERWIHTLAIAKPILGSDEEILKQKFEETQWWLANIVKIWAPLCYESKELSKNACIGCSSAAKLPLIDEINDGTEWLNILLNSLNLEKLALHEAQYSRAIPSLQMLNEEHHRILRELNQLEFELPVTFNQFIAHIMRIIDKSELPSSRTESKNIMILTPEEAFGMEADLIILAGIDAESWSLKAPNVPWLDAEARLKLGILNEDIEIRKARHQFKHLLNAAKTVIILDTSLDDAAGPCAPLAEFLEYYKKSKQFELMKNIPSFINSKNHDVNNLDRPWNLSTSDKPDEQHWLTPRPFTMTMSAQGVIGNRSGERGRDYIQRAGLRLASNQEISIAPISLTNLAKSNEFEIFHDRLKRQPRHKNLLKEEYLDWNSRNFMVSVDDLTLRPSKSQAEMVTIDSKSWPHLGKKGARSNSPAIDPRPLPPFNSGSDIFQSVIGITSQKLNRKFWSASRIQSWLRCPRGAWLEKHLLANQPEDTSEDIDRRTRGLLVHEILGHILQEHGLTIGGPPVSSVMPISQGRLGTIEKLWHTSLEFIQQNAPWLTRKNAVSHHRCREMLGIDSSVWQQHLAAEIILQPMGRIGRMLEAELAMKNSAPIACEWSLSSASRDCVITTKLNDRADFTFQLLGRIDRVDVILLPEELTKQAKKDGVLNDKQRWVIIRDLKNIEGPKQGKQGNRHRTAIFDEVQLALYARAWENAYPLDRVVGVGITEVGEKTHHYVEVDNTIMKYLDGLTIGVITNYTANHFPSQAEHNDGYISGFKAWIEERIQTSARAISSAEAGNFHPTPCQQCYYCKSSGMSPSAELGGGW